MGIPAGPGIPGGVPAGAAVLAAGGGISVCASFSISSVAPRSFGAVTFPGTGAGAGAAAAGAGASATSVAAGPGIGEGAAAGPGIGISGGGSSTGAPADASSTGVSLEPHPMNEKAKNAAIGKTHQVGARCINESSRRPEE